MPYCTVAEVRSCVNFPSTGAPVSDADILQFILNAEEEINNMYHTKFGSVEDSGTATGGSTSVLNDTSKTWTSNEFQGFVLWISGGIGSGQYRQISSNSATAISVSEPFIVTPNATSTYQILKLGYRSETVDGSGTETQFVVYQPLIELNKLVIHSQKGDPGVSVTPSTVYSYSNSGKLKLSSQSEERYFRKTTPQLVDMQYIYGVYPLPRTIKRLCIVIASLQTLVAQIAGTYDDFSTVALPAGFSASKGEPYVNIRSAVDQFQKEAKQLQQAYIPFTLFG